MLNISYTVANDKNTSHMKLVARNSNNSVNTQLHINIYSTYSITGWANNYSKAAYYCKQ